ncbi:MAG: tRNA threonylcarbamoyladenosine dehydratase [Clostridia bacterium]|nr:tRNA threonylcarbamoyladenosine dehydratase [Clostridia bacterium]
MKEQYSRTVGLIGEAAFAKLRKAHVAVFGIGGVGGHATEALARAGVGALTLVDHDTVSESNLNRQIIALHSTVGLPKVEVMAARIRDIDETIKVIPRKMLFLPENADEFDFAAYDYIVDAIDNVTAKIELYRRAAAAGTPVIAAMGTGGKLDPTALRVTDIHKTEGCPLARTVRGICRREGIKKLKVVFSPEVAKGTVTAENGRHAPASLSIVPATAGLLLAAEVIASLTAK